MTDALLAERIDANYRASFVAMARTAVAGEAVVRPKTVIAMTGVPAAFFNALFVGAPLDDPVADISEAIAYFDRRGRPFKVSIRDGLDPASDRACEDLGLTDVDLLPGMVLDDLGGGRRDIEDLEIRGATDPTVFDDHVVIAARNNDVPIELARALLTERLLDLPGVELYVGYLDAIPVTISALMALDGVAGVYNVATDEAYRRRGLGEAMTWHAIRRGRELGCDIAGLQASAMGQRVYARMGFRVVSTYRECRRPAPDGPTPTGGAAR